jgi:hypothetical protein
MDSRILGEQEFQDGGDGLPDSPVNFTIVVDTSSERFQSEVKAGKAVLVDLHLTIGDQAFPSAPFLDFPIVVLSWWLESLVDLSSGAKSVHHSFMNGPFEFVAENEGVVLCIVCRQRTLTGVRNVFPAQRVLLTAYATALTNAARVLLDALDLLGATGADIGNLSAALARIG